MSDENKRTILLVEDEAILGLTQKMELEEYGYNIIIANSGEKAFEVFKDNKNIDLILMDIDLGKGIDGTDAATLILKEGEIPVVFLSSHTEPEVVNKTEAITNYGYVVKNSGITVLDASIKMAFKLFDADENLRNELALRKQAERELIKNEAILTEAQKLSHIGHWYWDITTGKLIWSDEVFRIFGVDQKTYLVSAENFEKTIHPDDIDSFLKDREKMLAEENETEIGHRIIRPGGEIRYVIERSKVLRDTAGNALYVMGTVQDLTERKKAENELRESENRYRTLVESQLEVVCIWFPDTTLTFVNEAYCSLVGKSREEIIGKKWIEFIPENARSNVLENYKKAAATKQVYSYVHEVEGADKILWYSWNDVPLFDAEGNLREFQSVGHNITKRKLLEDELRASEEKYRVIFNNEIYAICIFDLETLKLLDANDAYIGLYGYSREELISGMTIHDITAEQQVSDAATEQAKRDGTIFISLRYHRKKDGTVFPVEIVGGPYEWKGRRVMFAIARDITERKHFEELVKNKELRLQNVITGTNVGTWEWNIQTGETVFDERWAEIVGYTLEELQPVSIETWMNLAHPDDLEKSDELLQKHFKGELDYYSFDSRMKHKDGSWIWVFDRGKVIDRDENGNPLKMFGTHADITGRKLAEEKIRNLLAEKEFHLSEVHRSVKENMSTIFKLLNLQSHALTEPSAVIALNDTKSRVQSMMVLYEKLYHSEDFRDLSIKEYLTALISEISVTLHGCERVKIESRIDDFPVGAKMLFPIGIIVNEMIVNAMKHAFAGAENELLIISAALEGSRAIIVVHDNGKGIPESINFWSSSGNLGLNIVSMLTEQIGGSIRIERGDGTRFVLELDV